MDASRRQPTTGQRIIVLFLLCVLVVALLIGLSWLTGFALHAMVNLFEDGWNSV